MCWHAQGGAPKLLGITRDLRAQRKDGTIFAVSISLGRITQTNTARDTFFIATMRHPPTPSPHSSASSSPAHSSHASHASHTSHASHASHASPSRHEPHGTLSHAALPVSPLTSTSAAQTTTTTAASAEVAAAVPMSEDDVLEHLSIAIANKEVWAARARAHLHVERWLAPPPRVSPLLRSRAHHDA